MNINDFCKEIEKQADEFDKLARKLLPIKIGSLAKRHYQDNFRKGGFVNKGLTPWLESKRRSTKSLNTKYGTLLSRQRNLFKGVTYVNSDYKVKILNRVPYAGIHNQGGVLHPKVTPKMRKFAWAKYFENTDTPKKGFSRYISKQKRNKSSFKQIEINKEAIMWKRLALTKKKQLSIKIPQRKFLAESEELNIKIKDIIETEITKTLEIK